MKLRMVTWFRANVGWLILAGFAGWLGYSLGYIEAMNERAATAGYGAHVAQIVSDREGAFYLQGDPAILAKLLRVWGERDDAERRAAP